MANPLPSRLVQHLPCCLTTASFPLHLSYVSLAPPQHSLGQPIKTTWTHNLIYIFSSVLATLHCCCCCSWGKNKHCMRPLQHEWDNPLRSTTQWQPQPQSQSRPDTASIQAHRQPFRKYNHSIKINSKRVCEAQTDSASWREREEVGDGRVGSGKGHTHGIREGDWERKRPTRLPYSTQSFTHTHENVTHLLNIREFHSMPYPCLLPDTTDPIWTPSTSAI